MKLHAGTHTLEKNGTFEESKFSIEASSKAFFILSDGLYSNKILAVIRELSTNAYDSHIEAGKPDMQFDVHLPTILNPVFFIRDYGTSMNHENCMQLYTTYFRSTRNNSNDAVGCLGLGSKAPFAYADSFTVDAYLDGEHRVYTAYKDENGSPVFSLMETVSTNEPNGIKVSISVKNEDIGKFQMEASKVYEFFKVKPNFIGKTIEFSQIDKLIEGENWYFDDNGYDNYIIMGQIAYPIDHNQLIDNDNKYHKFILNSEGLRVFVNIGDVDITPSRESLSYSTQTKINIKKYIDQVLTDISNKITSEIKTQTTLFLARKRYVQIHDRCSSIRNALESLRSSIIWNDIKLFDNFIDESIDIKTNMSIKRLDKSYWKKKVVCSDDVKSLSFDSKCKLFIDDLPRGGIGRIRNLVKDTSARESFSGYVYSLGIGETIDDCSFYKLLGGATKEDVILTSSLPKVTYSRNNTGSSSGPVVQAMVFNVESGSFEDCSMSVKYENAYYLTESKGEITFDNGNSCDIHIIAQALSIINEQYPNDVDDKTFYLLKPSVIKNRNISDRSNWHNAEQFICEKINDLTIKNKQDIYDRLNSTKLIHSRAYRWIDIISQSNVQSSVKDLVSEYNEFAKKLESQSSKLDTLINLRRLPNITKINHNDPDLIHNDYSSKLDKYVEESYPLLRFMTVPWSDVDKKLVVDYINMVDNKINS